jgi:hypothetical protein
VRRTLLCLIVAVMAATAAGACSGDSTPSSGSPDSNDTDLGYDRTASDPQALAALLATADRVADTVVGCVDPTELPVDLVRSNHEPVRLPVPIASVDCSSIDEENFLFEAFEDERGKLGFIAAKRELLCERGKKAGTDPATGRSGWDGLPYVDGGTWILEPDTAEHRDVVAQALSLQALNMCDNVDPEVDPAPFPEL